MDKPQYYIRVDARHHPDPNKQVRLKIRPHVNTHHSALGVFYNLVDTYAGIPCELWCDMPETGPFLVDRCE